MTDFISAFNHLAILGPEACDDLRACISFASYDRGEPMLKRGEICRRLYFIEQGLTKTFFTTEDKEFIMRFFPERSLVTVLDSFETQTPSNYQIMALEPTTVSFLTKTHLEELCIRHRTIESAFRKLLSIATINMMKRISEMLEESATERYNHFLHDNNHLIHRISLGDLANYLGITQVSLSRIRANK